MGTFLDELFDGLSFDTQIVPANEIGMEFFRDPAGWLYSGWSEQKYKEYLKLASVPGVNTYMDYLLDRRSTSEYLNRYGMDYDDIHDPRKLSQTGSTRALYGSVMNFASRNIGKLYR